MKIAIVCFLFSALFLLQKSELKIFILQRARFENILLNFYPRLKLVFFSALIAAHTLTAVTIELFGFKMEHVHKN